MDGESSSVEIADLWADLCGFNSSRDEVERRLEGAIRDGRLPPGSRLPSERALAEASGLARNTLRLALGRLTERGLIVRHVGRGSFVARQVQHETRSKHDTGPRDLVEFRIVCEPLLPALIIMNATDAELKELETWTRNGEITATWADCETVDAGFHARLFSLTRNAVFHHIGEYMSAQRKTSAWLSLKQQTFSLERWQHYHREHERIAQLLRSRDGSGAQAALKDHLGRVQSWVER